MQIIAHLLMFEFNSLKTHFFQIHFQPIFFQENNFTHKTKLFFFLLFNHRYSTKLLYTKPILSKWAQTNTKYNFIVARLWMVIGFGQGNLPQEGNRTKNFSN